MFGGNILWLLVVVQSNLFVAGILSISSFFHTITERASEIKRNMFPSDFIQNNHLSVSQSNG